MSARTFLVFMAILAVIGLLGYGVISKGEEALSVGDPAPDEELPRLEGGGSGRIADYRGKWVLVNFWASWCEPCKGESPALQRFHAAHAGKSFTVLGIDLDDGTDDARAFVRDFGIDYPQLRDGDGRDRRDAYGMTGFPESFLVDPEGEIALIRRGPVDQRYLDENVAPLIAGES
jgi:cytochrome c biogenesis protein CcmG/thiol:disulfide interchange protein DsbE